VIAGGFADGIVQWPTDRDAMIQAWSRHTKYGESSFLKCALDLDAVVKTLLGHSARLDLTLDTLEVTEGFFIDEDPILKFTTGFADVFSVLLKLPVVTMAQSMVHEGMQSAVADLVSNLHLAAMKLEAEVDDSSDFIGCQDFG